MLVDTTNNQSVELTANTTKSGKLQGFVLLLNGVQYDIKALRGSTLTQSTVLQEVKRLCALATGKKSQRWLDTQILACTLWQAKKPEKKARSSQELMRSYERTNKLAERESRQHTLGTKRKGGSRKLTGLELEIFLHNKIG